MHKIVVAITGASGAVYARQLLNRLSGMPQSWEQVGIVLSKNASTVWETELNERPEMHLNQKGFRVYASDDFNAPFASGSAGYQTMVIIPCSMGTLGRIAQGSSNDLITRAADVILKERRKLICVARETPYNLIHIRNMETITLAGGIICPATPSFYSKPQSVEEVIATVTNRVIDLMGLKSGGFQWGDESLGSG